MKHIRFIVLIVVLVLNGGLFGQGGSGGNGWTLVRGFEELSYPLTAADRGGVPVYRIGGFDVLPDGDIFLWHMWEGRFFRYEADEEFRIAVETPTVPVSNGSSSRGRFRGDYYYFDSPDAAYFLVPDDNQRGFHDPVVIDYHELGFTLGSYLSLVAIPFGPLLLIDLDDPGHEHSVEIFPDDRDREPEYRDAAATREMIEERGEELGLYFDEAGYLWARDEPHDWLVTSNPETFNEVFGLPNRGGASGDFAGRDREGNYYWGSPFRYKVMAPDGRILRDVIPEAPDLGTITGTRVNSEGVLMFFAYNGKPYNYERERLDLYRLDTGIITGR